LDEPRDVLEAAEGINDGVEGMCSERHGGRWRLALKGFERWTVWVGQVNAIDPLDQLFKALRVDGLFEYSKDEVEIGLGKGNLVFVHIGQKVIKDFAGLCRETISVISEDGKGKAVSETLKAKTKGLGFWS
jgi:hypothetical protein